MPVEQWREKWKVIRELGQGGQGTTYEVESFVETGQRGVLKLLRNDADLKARSRMAHEAINLATLVASGVKVPQLLDHNTQSLKDTDIQLYLVMEFVGGITLDQFVKSRAGRLTLEESVAITRNLCSTMAAMHAVDVLHRDLKPANLMVRDGTKPDVVVLDLGLSYNRGRAQENVTGTTETIKNELLWLPEAINVTGNRQDPRSDITNIVGVFFFCLTGKLPRHLLDEKSRAPHQVDGCRMQEIMRGDRRANQLELLFDSGFANDIESRFQSVTELENRLSMALTASDSGKKDPVQVASELARRLRRSNRRLHLQQFVPAAQVVAGHLQAHIHGLTGKLDVFSLSWAGISTNLPLPEGLDSVYEIPHAVAVALQTHPNSRTLKFQIAAKGERCVLISARFTTGGFQQIKNAERWEEVGWFNPANPPNLEQVAEWLNPIIATTLEEFEKEVVSVASANV